MRCWSEDRPGWPTSSSCRPATGVRAKHMYDINVADLTTADQEFPLVRDAVLDRYGRLYSRHTPGGKQILGRDAPAREVVARSYTIVIVNHAHTMADVFRSGRFASGFALARPMLEAMLKQTLLFGTNDDGDWESIADQRIPVTRASLRDLSARTGAADLGPLWRGLSPWLNDFVHGGRGQLKSNPINEDSRPIYPGDWFWTAMLAATIAVLTTHGLFWAHLGNEARAKSAIDDMAAENWDVITTSRNGQNVRIVGRSPAS